MMTTWEEGDRLQACRRCINSYTQLSPLQAAVMMALEGEYWGASERWGSGKYRGAEGVYFKKAPSWGEKLNPSGKGQAWNTERRASTERGLKSEGVTGHWDQIRDHYVIILWCTDIKITGINTWKDGNWQGLNNYAFKSSHLFFTLLHAITNYCETC